MSTLSDRELIESLLFGSGRTFKPFETLVQRYEPMVYRLCLRYFRSPEIAQDMSQETLLKAYGQLKNLEDPDAFKAWVLRMASNLCTDHYRKLKRRQEIQEQIEQEFDRPNLEQPLIEEGLQNEKLMAALEKLQEKERNIIFLHYFSELSVKEVALNLGIGESAVKMRLSRSREKLEELMRKM